MSRDFQRGEGKLKTIIALVVLAALVFAAFRVVPVYVSNYELEDATHPLEEADIKRANDALKNDPFIRHHKEWQDALNHMIKLGVRVEQQAFAKHGLNFVLDTYLPDKLKKARFLP